MAKIGTHSRIYDPAVKEWYVYNEGTRNYHIESKVTGKLGEMVRAEVARAAIALQANIPDFEAQASDSVSAAHAVAQDPASNKETPAEPDEVKRVAAEIEELKNAFKGLEAKTLTSEKLVEIGKDLVSLDRQHSELRKSIGDTDQVKEFGKNIHDLGIELLNVTKYVSQVRDEHEAASVRLGQVSDKVDATANTLRKAGRGIVDRFKEVEARVNTLEDRPAESAANPQTPPSSPRDDAGRKEEAMPQTENRTETTSNSQASQPPHGDARPKEKTVSIYRNVNGAAMLAAAAIAVAVTLFFSGTFNPGPQKVVTAVGTGESRAPAAPDASQVGESRAPAAPAAPQVSEHRIAEIAGATFDLRIKPVNNDLEKLQAKTDKLESNVSDTKNAVAGLDGKFTTFQNTMDGVKKLLEEKQKKDAVSANEAVEARRLALVRAQCLPGAEKDLNLKADLPEELFQSALSVCRAEKEEKMRQAQMPVGSLPQPQAQSQAPYVSADAGDPPTASTGDADAVDGSSSESDGAYASANTGDDSSAAPSEGDDLTGSYDPRTAKAMSAHVAQASYVGPGGPGFGPSGRGPRGGAVRCPPGMRMTPIGLCGITVMADQRIKDRYNVPPQVARCRPGDVRTFKQPLPGGGMRVVHQTCRR
jgi:hypothetical protein